MPREVFDIKSFDYGIISSVDEEDIPAESASNSLNVDGDVGEGILQGIKTDTEFTVGGGSLANVKLGEFIQVGTEYHFIYHDASANSIVAIMDYYGSTNQKKLTLISGLTAGKQVCMTANKQQVHIGIEDGTSKWVGYLDHGIFGLGTSWEVSGTADNGAGAIRIFTTAQHGLQNGDVVKIASVGGTTEANGYWVVSAVNNYDAGATDAYFTLTGSTYSNAWTAGGTVTYTLAVANSACANISGDSADTIGIPFAGGITEAAAADGYFITDTYHEWRVSFVYDGIEESGLSAYPAPNSWGDVASATIPYYELQLKAYNAELTAANPTFEFSRRLTAINLYRADANSNVSGDIGLFRKVVSISLVSSAYWQTSTNDKIVYLRDYGTYVILSSTGGAAFTTSATVISESVTYKENSGFGETTTTNYMNWAIATQGVGYHFVGLPYIAGLTSKNTIYRSKTFRFDTFDYTIDFVVLPDYPVALQFYEGRLFAFTANKVFRINPESLVIEDVFEDAGAQSARSVHVNEYGLFFANNTNAWMLSNNQFTRIGDAIRNSASGGRSWATFTRITLDDIVVTSDGGKGYVIFLNEYLTTTPDTYNYMAFAYHPGKKRWDCWTFGEYGSSANGGIIKGKDGEVYLSNGSKTYKLMRDTSYQAWDWYSQDLTLGSTQQNKSIVMVKVDATGTVAIDYGLDGATVNVSYTNGALINQYKKSIRIKLSASSGTNSVDSMEIIYRPLIGAR